MKSTWYEVDTLYNNNNNNNNNSNNNKLLCSTMSIFSGRLPILSVVEQLKLEHTIPITLHANIIVSSIRTNRARCALYKKILDLLIIESVSGESSGRASL